MKRESSPASSVGPKIEKYKGQSLDSKIVAECVVVAAGSLWGVLRVCSGLCRGRTIPRKELRSPRCVCLAAGAAVGQRGCSVSSTNISCSIVSVFHVFRKYLSVLSPFSSFLQSPSCLLLFCLFFCPPLRFYRGVQKYRSTCSSLGERMLVLQTVVFFKKQMNSISQIHKH